MEVLNQFYREIMQSDVILMNGMALKKCMTTHSYFKDLIEEEIVKKRRSFSSLVLGNAITWKELRSHLFPSKSQFWEETIFKSGYIIHSAFDISLLGDDELFIIVSFLGDRDWTLLLWTSVNYEKFLLIPSYLLTRKPLIWNKYQGVKDDSKYTIFPIFQKMEGKNDKELRFIPKWIQIYLSSRKKIGRTWYSLENVPFPLKNCQSDFFSSIIEKCQKMNQLRIGDVLYTNKTKFRYFYSIPDTFISNTKYQSILPSVRNTIINNNNNNNNNNNRENLNKEERLIEMEKKMIIPAWYKVALNVGDWLPGKLKKQFYCYQQKTSKKIEIQHFKPWAIKNIEPASPLECYPVNGDQMVSEGSFVVLLVQELPLGKINGLNAFGFSTELEYPDWLCGRTFSFHYGVVDFKIFTTKQEAIGWRNQQIDFTASFYLSSRPRKTIMPGDFVLSKSSFYGDKSKFEQVIGFATKDDFSNISTFRKSLVENNSVIINTYQTHSVSYRKQKTIFSQEMIYRNQRKKKISLPFSKQTNNNNKRKKFVSKDDINDNNYNNDTEPTKSSKIQISTIFPLQNSFSLLNKSSPFSLLTSGIATPSPFFKLNVDNNNNNNNNNMKNNSDLKKRKNIVPPSSMLEMDDNDNAQPSWEDQIAEKEAKEKKINNKEIEQIDLTNTTSNEEYEESKKLNQKTSVIENFIFTSLPIHSQNNPLSNPSSTFLVTEQSKYPQTDICMVIKATDKSSHYIVDPQNHEKYYHLKVNDQIRFDYARITFKGTITRLMNSSMCVDNIYFNYPSYDEIISHESSSLSSTKK